MVPVFVPYFFSQDAVVDNPDTKMRPEAISFTDEIFNGSQYTFDFLIEEYYFGSSKSLSGDGYEDDETWEFESIYISMSRVSQEYYWYENSYQAYLFSYDNMFSQPVQVYTNIENGLGIFAGYSSRVDTISVHPPTSNNP